jgi:hypothetical protein
MPLCGRLVSSCFKSLLSLGKKKEKKMKQKKKDNRKMEEEREVNEELKRDVRIIVDGTNYQFN